ncbi:hypothetical protein HK099_004981 [Clydaea vesicula]|uniref:Uncharacterized protein n=1 Tax=Clydaea vesicula TaxID=447962 RepID=A0AAD5XYS6_9FUNG|nr:hypothetical protein HK099_004981 [Clydaea vesicula]
MIVTLGIASFDYEAIEDNEISFCASDTIYITEMCNSDWFTGYTDPNRMVLGVKVTGQQIIVNQLDSNASENIATGDFDADTNIENFGNSNSFNETQILNVASRDIPVVDFTDNKESIDNLLSTEQVDKINSPENNEKGKLEETLVDLTVKASLNEQPDDNLPPFTALSNDVWQPVQNDQGQTYYWNPTTGETSWNLPNEKDSVENEAYNDLEWTKAFEKNNSSESLPEAPMNLNLEVNVDDHKEEEDEEEGLNFSEMNLDYFNFIPNEYIKKQGMIGKKFKSKAKNNELVASGQQQEVSAVSGMKKKSTWKNYWCVVVVGFIFFFKHQPGKSKKIEKPKSLIKLKSFVIENASKTDSKKKNVFSLSCVENNGEDQFLFLSLNESDMLSWMDCISECFVENNAIKEVDEVINLIFVKNPILSSEKKSTSILMKIPSRFRSSSGGSEQEQQTSSIITPQQSKKSSKFGFFNKKNSPSNSNVNQSSNSHSNIIDYNKYNNLELEKVFENSLESQINFEYHIPKIVLDCVKEVEFRGLLSQGIYRLSGTSSVIKDLKAKYDRHEAVNLSEESLDINAIASLLKCE